MKSRVLVTGMGIVSSIGFNVNDFSQSLKHGNTNFGYLPGPEISMDSAVIGATIKDFSLNTLLDKYTWLPVSCSTNILRYAGRSPLPVIAGVIAASEAWNNADLFNNPVSPERTGIIIAGQNLSNNYQFQLYDKFIKGPEYLTPRYAIEYLDTNIMGILSEIFQIHGEGFTTGGASASGNVGLVKGYQLIEQGDMDICMVVGCLADLSPMDLQGFKNSGAMGGKKFKNNPRKACRPFDEEHEGFIYGQASGCIILESSGSVEKRKTDINAELLGGAIVLDGNRMADPRQEGEVRAMATALKKCQLKPGDIDYLNTHGTSSPIGDNTEIDSIKEVFKNNLSTLIINSTKGLTGHCLYSAGVVELIATIIQLQNNFVHPNINLDNPVDEVCRFAGSVAETVEINIGMSNSFGFGGMNTSIVIKKI
ncbi:MAG: hypothetical protein JXB88_04050 [Spirochaetales bacterium]|nr:hypothetical protein [Spirochaetales bacterium]